MRRGAWMVLGAALAVGACGRGGGAAEGGEARAGGGAGAATHSDSAPAPGAMPQGVTAEQGRRGRELYAGSCIVCHGEDGRGNQLGPSIADGEWKNAPGGSLEEIATLVRNGVPQPEEFEVPMPAYGGILSDDEIRAVSAYTWSLGH